MLTRLIAVTFIIFTAPVALQGLSQAQNDNKQAQLSYVQNICDYSRSVYSGYWEDKCGQAQDQTNTKYICDSYKLNAHCWVEGK